MSVAGLAENACGAIGSLAVNNDNKIRLAGAGACEAVTRALEQHMSVADVAKSASGAICNLAWNSNDNKIRLAGAGACEAVTRALQQHMSVAGVVESACEIGRARD